MAKIEELLLSRINTVRPELDGTRKMSVIIEAKNNSDLDNIVKRLRAQNASGIRRYRFSSSVAAKIPVSEIKFYERMPGVEKLWDGIGNVVIPPLPETGIELQLVESIPLIMEHADYYLADNFPENNEPIDGSGVKVCIIDSGIDMSHPDLEEQVAVIEDFTEDENGIDYIGHGTHVAGIIAGTGNASEGNLTGVAPGVELYIAKVFPGNGGGAELTNILDAIEWAVDHKMDVVNMSLGSAFPGCDGTCHLCRAADWAAENGVAVILSAGNSGSRKGTITCPANSRYCLTVGAMDKNRRIAEFSSRGPTLDGRPKPDVVTPGVAIKAARAANTVMGTPVDEYYTIASGTSMAAPHSTGIASLLIQIYRHYSKSEFGNEVQLSPKDLKNIMMQGTIEIDTDANTGGRGLVNVPLCVKTMEDSGRIPAGLVAEKNGDEVSENGIGVGDIKLALDILNILLYLYKKYLQKDKQKTGCLENVLVADPSLEPSIQKTVELAAAVAEFHLAELGIPLDCNVHFLNEKNEVVLSLGETTPRERINCSGFMGLYKPGSQSAYIRLMDLPEMISTIAHENAHHFLTKQSTLGQFMKNLDGIYEIHKEGSDVKVDTIIGNVRQDYGVLFNVSKNTHEGFASWVGHYVLRRFVDTLKQETFENENIDSMKLNLLIDAYEHLSRDLDKRASEYYYGRLQYCTVEDFFGASVVPIAAIYCMDIEYNVEELHKVLELNQALINQDAEIMYKNLDALRFSPDLRLAAVSKILPGLVRSSDDISKIDEPKYFLNAIRRFLGDNFLETGLSISSLELEEEKEDDSLNRTGVVIGEILAEIAYGDTKEINRLISELLGLVKWAPIVELARSMELFSNSIVKHKAKEILDANRLSDNNIRLGEAIYLLGQAKRKEQIIDVLRVLKDYNSDAEKIYGYVSRDEFKGSWQNWLKELQAGMSAR